MNFIKKGNLTGYIFVTFLILSLSISILYKYVLFYHGVHLKYTWVTDLMFFVIINMWLIHKRIYNLILIVVLLLLIKAIGSFFIYEFYENQLDYFKEVSKTSFSFTIIFFVFTYIKDIKLKGIAFIFQVFKYISIVINIAIILGFIFNITVFKTYTGVRFGFSGLLFPQSFSSYFVIVSLLIYYFYNNNIERTSPLFIAVTTLSALLVGTKSVYIFLFFFTLMLFFNYKLYKNKVFMLSTSFLFAVIAFYYNTLKSYLLDKFIVLYDVYRESGLLTFLLSFRDLSFLKAKAYVEDNWDMVNYFFGGVNRKVMLVEMELVDILLSFGVLGSVLLIYFYYKFILKSVAFERTSFLLYGVLFFIIMMSGNFFKSLTIHYFIAYALIILTYKPKVFTKND